MTPAQPSRLSLNVAPDVGALVGDDLVARFRRELRDPVRCARCRGLVENEGELVLEVAERSGAPVVSLAVTHHRCARSGIVRAPATGLPGLDDANIALVSRPDPAPRALALVDFLCEFAAFPEHSVDPQDLRIANLLEQGFRLQSQPLIEADGPLVTAWSATYVDGVLRISGNGLPLFEGAIAVTPAWDHLGHEDAAVLVVAGSRIGIGGLGVPADLDRLEMAIREGRVVAARIPWQPRPA